MLRAGKVVDACVRVRLQIAALSGADVNERGIPAPVIERAVGVEGLGNRVPLTESIEETRAGVAVGVSRREIREGEPLSEARRVGHRGLRETLVEFSANRAGDVCQQPVERGTGLLVQVQSELEKVSQQATGLRGAETVDPGKSLGTRALRSASAQEYRRIAQGE